MISYNKALKILLSSKIKIKNEVVLSKNSSNRIAAKNIYSPSNYPIHLSLYYNVVIYSSKF